MAKKIKEKIIKKQKGMTREKLIELFGEDAFYHDPNNFNDEYRSFSSRRDTSKDYRR